MKYVINICIFKSYRFHAYGDMNKSNLCNRFEIFYVTDVLSYIPIIGCRDNA